MFEVRGFWLPDGEKHLGPLVQESPEFAGGPTYQLRKLLPMLQHIANFRHCLDIGAHCGLWTRPLARMFTHVTAFEPVPRHIECFKRNIDMSNVTLFEVALGAEAVASVTLHTQPNSSGDTIVGKDGEHSAPMKTLDGLLAGSNVVPIDFVKLDCEGYEYFILKGGERVIRAHRPTILVEQKPGKGMQFGIADNAALKLLANWGAKQVFVLSGDYGFIFKG